MTNTQTHEAIDGSERAPLPGAKATSRANRNTTIDVTLKLKGKKKLPTLNARPATPLTREQLGKEYGASQADIDKVTETFSKFGLKTVETNQTTRTVKLRGTVAAVEDAFHVHLFNYSGGGHTYRGRVGAYSVPNDLAGIVTAVTGLDTRQIAHRRQRAPGGHRLAAAHDTWYTPKQLASHYNFPAGDGSGQSVGILEFDGAFLKDDLQQFCTKVGISTLPKVTAISVDGTPTDNDNDATGEVMLDVEIVAGICPKAKIVLYFAQFTEQGWLAALDAVINDKTNDPGVLSCSWGLAEFEDWSAGQGWTAAVMDEVNDSLNALAQIGVTVCVAAGDDGSSDAISDGTAHADFPASSPNVLSIGGTTVKGDGKADVVWFEGTGVRDQNFEDGSTGGGVSSYFPTPDWQKSVSKKSVNQGAIDGRNIPDLAANADWYASPYLLVLHGQAQPNGGTSAAAPLVAGLLTLINATRPATKRVGYLTPVLYQTSGTGTVGSVGCTDVVGEHDNKTAAVGGYSPGPGYDPVSGWGTPNGKQLAGALSTAIPP